MLSKFYQIVLSIFLLHLIRLNSADCPEQSLAWGSHCYFVQTNVMSFMSAENKCKTLGGHLASIRNMVENVFLSEESLINIHDPNVNSLWIGGFLSSDQSAWTWTDDSMFEFINWGKGQPTKDKYCLSMNIKYGHWQSEDCFKEKPFICGVASVPPPINHCELGWIHYEPTRSCFGISYRGQKHPIVTNWEEGKAFCKNLGADLPSFHDINEFYVLQAFIITAMKPIWVGLQSTDNSNTWSWSDGSVANYLPWYKKNGFPVAMDISCAMAEMSFITNHDCNSKAWVICKRASL